MIRPSYIFNVRNYKLNSIMHMILIHTFLRSIVYCEHKMFAFNFFLSAPFFANLMKLSTYSCTPAALSINDLVGLVGFVEGNSD